MFYVLEGELMLMQGKGTFVGGVGTAVFLKRGMVHTFKNVGKGAARFLTFAVPGNFEAFVREAGERIETIPCDKQVTPAIIERLKGIAPRHDIEMKLEHKPEGEVAGPGEGKRLWVLGSLVTVKLGSAETGGKFCVAEVALQPGGFVPSHSHNEMDELFHVIEGEYEFGLDGQTRRVGVGGTVYVPRGTRHGFRNVGTGVARMADVHTPGGFERFFEECGTACTDAAKPGTRVPEEAELGRLFEKHGMVMG